jgi:hypothetical protein
MTQLYLYAKKGFTVFLNLDSGVIFLGLFSGALVVLTPTGWLRYLASFVVFIIALFVYNDCKKK